VAAESRAELHRSYWLVFIALALIFVLMELLAQPYGNFPLNDDWSYARVVKTLIDEHRLTVTPWTLSASITPVLAGALWCGVFGFSFESLRLLTVVCSLLTLAGVAYLFKQMRVTPLTMFLLLLTLAANPLVFCLTNTFMTDVPALSLLVWTCCFYWRYFQNPHWTSLAAATLLSGALCLTRQVLVLAPISFLLACIFGLEPQRTGRALAVGRAAIPALTALLCVWAHQQWLMHTGGVPFCYQVETTYISKQFSQGFIFMVLQVLQSGMVALIYLGLFLLPVLIGFLPGLLCGRQRPEKVFLLALSLEIFVLVGAGLLWKHSLMPLADNVIYDLGIGPVLLPGSHAPVAAPAFWLAVTAAGLLGAGLLVAYLVAAARGMAESRVRQPRPENYSLMLFSWFFVLLYLFVICLRGFFDRYLIALMPFLLLIIADVSSKQSLKASLSRAAAGVGATAGLVFCIFSVMGVHDYFSWNRARWQSWHYLTERQNARAADINGGLEINGWLSSDPGSGSAVPTDNTDLARGDLYAISTSPLNNYQVLAQFPYARLLSGQSGSVFALKKVEPIFKR
jgi:hypothetical protein